MSKARFLDNPGVSAFGSSNNSLTSTSASYAATATSASYAVTASHALFAVSASHEIVKEVSSSHANTADVAGGLQGQPSISVTNVTASGNVSGSATSTASFGTYLGDGSQLSNISTTPFPFSGSAVITGSLVISGSNTAMMGLPNAADRIAIGGSGNSFHIQHQGVGTPGIGDPLPAILTISGSGGTAGGNQTLNIGSRSSTDATIGDETIVRFNFFTGGRLTTLAGGTLASNAFVFSVSGSSVNGNGGVISLGRGGTTPSNSAKIHLNGHLTSSAGVNISASATSTITSGFVTSITSSHDYIQAIEGGNNIKIDGKDGGVSLHYTEDPDFASIEISDNIKLNVSSDSASINLSQDGIELRGPIRTYAITASVNVSSSATSTASFGTYLGDGSQLSGISAGSTFPFSGSAVITGSLVISGSQTSNTKAVEKVDLGRYHIKTLNSYDTGFFGTLGGQLIISSSDFTYKSPTLVLDRGAGGPSGATDGLNLWVKKDLFVGGSSQLGDNIMTIFKVSGSATTGNGGQIDLGGTGLTTDIALHGHLTASAGVNISASATSTASFGTYLGDGSQLSGISAGSTFPFNGDAQITGSLLVSGSSEVTGSFSVTSDAGHMFQINNDGTFTLGDGATVSSTNSTAVGFGANASGNATAYGNVANASGGGANSFGSFSSATANYSIAFGYDADSTAAHAISIGAGMSNSGANSIILDSSGTNNAINTDTKVFKVFMTDHLTPDVQFGNFSTKSILRSNIEMNNPSASAATSSLSVHGSGSTVFEVLGSVGTLFSVDDSLTGTVFSANDISGLPVLQADATGEVYLGKSPQSLYTTATISSTTANITQSIYGLSTSSYEGVFVDYTATSASNARAGNITAIWNGSSLNFAETTTTDIGDTSNLIMQIAISQSQAQVQSYSTAASYKIKTIIRSI